MKQVRSKTRKSSEADRMGVLADNEGVAELLEPLAPVEKPAVFGPHEAESRSLLPELKQAYLQDQAYGDPDDVVKNACRSRKVIARNGLWYRQSVICIPDSPLIKRKILTELHDSQVAGHGGELRTVQLLRRFFWWASLDRDCRQYVKGCDQCQRNKASTRKQASRQAYPA